MINGLFKEISEEEMMSVNGGCGGDIYGNLPSPGGQGWQVVSVQKYESCQACSDKAASNFLKTVTTAVAAFVSGLTGPAGAATAVAVAQQVNNAIDKEYNCTEHNPNAYHKK